MRTYERTLRVDAPLSAVWAFHSRVEGLVALTPDWANLRVESVTGPDGDANPDVLSAGTRIELSLRPFGVGPRQSWTSVIAEREERDGAAYFVDEMESGPFPHWTHTHLFYADGDNTLIRDQVEYDPPAFVPGPVADLGLATMFRLRHTRTRERFRGE